MDIQPLVGSTLRAALKWQCDATGAGYAIFWTQSGTGQLVVTGDYTTDQRRQALRSQGMESSFAIDSEGFMINSQSDDPVAMCFKTKSHVFLNKASQAEMLRADLAKKYMIAQIAFVPFEGGVMEYGTSEGAETASWPNNFAKIPKAPTLPKAEMRYAYDSLGASYTMFWGLDDSRKSYTIVAEHVTTARRAALKLVRGDGKTFCSESRAFAIDAASDDPIATAARTGEPVEIDDVTTMKRAALAQEFQINKVSAQWALFPSLPFPSRPLPPGPMRSDPLECPRVLPRVSFPACPSPRVLPCSSGSCPWRAACSSTACRARSRSTPASWMRPSS
jgi:hypothetical protein